MISVYQAALEVHTWNQTVEALAALFEKQVQELASQKLRSASVGCPEAGAHDGQTNPASQLDRAVDEALYGHILGPARDRLELFSNGDPAGIDGLLAHHRMALAIAYRILYQNSLEGLLEYALNFHPYGICLVEADSSVVFANSWMHNVFSRADGLRVDDRMRLSAVHACDGARLRRSLSNSPDEVYSGGACARVKRFRISRCSDKRPYLLIMEWPSHTGVPYRCPALLRIVDPEAPLAVDRTLLRSVFGFTERQAELAELLATGSDLKEGAGAMGLCYTTARSYLEDTMHKAGVHRQSDLIRLTLVVASSACPPGGNRVDSS